MIQKAIAKYGLAFHLALLAALPTALAPFIEEAMLGRVTLWLSFFAVVWLFMLPSVRPKEHLSSARARVFGALVRDPVCGFLLFYVVFCAMRWLNTGSGMEYDATKVAWSVSAPLWPILPSAVGDAGFLPFAVSVACLVLAAGIRFGMGLGARISFGLTGAFWAGLGALALAALSCMDVEPYVSYARTGFDVAQKAPVGSLFGIWLFVALAAGVQAETRYWRRARFFFFLAVGGNATGVVFFLPPLAAALYLLAALLFAVFCLVWVRHAAFAGALVRSAFFLILGLALPFVILMAGDGGTLRTEKWAALDPQTAWTDSMKNMDKALSRMSKQMWLQQPWSGVGLRAYALHAPFVAQNEDWEVIPLKPTRALNGYWTLLAERGNVACGVVAMGLAFMLWLWGARAGEAFGRVRSDPDADAFLFACPPVVWTPLVLLPLLIAEGLFMPTYALATLLLAAMGALMLATASFPRRAHAEKRK